ncbi:MAG: Rv3654c family TadE-like protein [Candidatus Nanopelagicales bacterium]
MSCQARQHRADRGAATIYVMAMALICLVAAVVAVAIGEVAITRARASSAADLAALAAADNRQSGAPCARADSVAAAGGARLTSCEQVGSDVLVQVEDQLPRMVRMLAGAAGQRAPIIHVVARAGPPQ